MFGYASRFLRTWNKPQNRRALRQCSNRSCISEAQVSAVVFELENNSTFRNRFRERLSSDTRTELAEDPSNPNSLSISTDIANSKLVAVAIQSGIPFIGFGFLDNVIMILAGNAIEQSLGLVLGLSTLAAAALGNLVSDVAGIGMGSTIEAGAHRLGVPDPKLTKEESRLGVVRTVRGLASALGIAVGCLLGMTPLFFIDTDITMLKLIFQELDSNGDGNISSEELQSAFSRLAGIELSEDELTQLMNNVDVDHDGEISFDEFCALVKHWRSTTASEKLKDFTDL